MTVKKYLNNNTKDIITEEEKTDLINKAMKEDFDEYFEFWLITQGYSLIDVFNMNEEDKYTEIRCFKSVRRIEVEKEFYSNYSEICEQDE